MLHYALYIIEKKTHFRLTKVDDYKTLVIQCISMKSRRYWDGVMPSDFLNTFVKTL